MRFFTTLVCALALAGLTFAIDIPDRLARAKAGEWVIMQDVSGTGGGGRTTLAIDEVRGSGSDAVVVLKIQREGADPRTIEIPLERHAARRAELLDKVKQISQERLTVKGAEIPVTALSWDEEDDGERKEFRIWLSEEIPVMGMVKSWSSDPGMPAGEVVDFGF